LEDLKPLTLILGSGSLFEVEQVGFTVFSEWRHLATFQRIRDLFRDRKVLEGILINHGGNILVGNA
jgi:hypothetical protein